MYQGAEITVQNLTEMSLGENICRFRRLKNLRQSDLATTLGVHPSHVTRWERDQVRPSQKYLEQISEALSVTIPQLLSNESEELATGLVEDEELLALVKQIPRLSERQKSALKNVLKDMIKVSHFQEVMQI
ncbi:MAG: helix-turn-helix domain-containing protein [Vulcanimicrobiota bacterium]